MSSYWYGYNTDSKFKLGQPAPKRIHMIDAFVPFPYNDVWFDNGFLLPPPRALNRSNVKTGPRSGSRWRKGSEMKELREQEEELAGYLPYDVDEVQSKKKKKTDEEKKKEHFVDALRQTLRPELLVNVEAAMREPTISVPDEEATTEVEIQPQHNIPTTIAATDDVDDDDDDVPAKIPLLPSGNDTDDEDDVGSIESVKTTEAKKEDAVAKAPETKKEDDTAKAAESKKEEKEEKAEKKPIIDYSSIDALSEDELERRANKSMHYFPLKTILEYVFFWKPNQITQKNVYRKWDQLLDASETIRKHNYSPYDSPIEASNIWDFFFIITDHFVHIPPEVREGKTDFNTYINTVQRFMGLFVHLMDRWKPAIYTDMIKKLFDVYILQNPLADPNFVLPFGEKINSLWIKNTFKFAAIMFFNGYRLNGVRYNKKDETLMITPILEKKSAGIVVNLESLKEGASEFTPSGNSVEQLVLFLPTWVQKTLVPSINELLKSLENVPSESTKLVETCREIFHGKYTTPYIRLPKEKHEEFQYDMLNFIRIVMVGSSNMTRPFEMCPAMIRLGPTITQLLESMRKFIQYNLTLNASGTIQDMATNKVRFLSSMLQKEQQKRADDRQVNHAIALWRQHKAKRFLDAARDRDYPI